MHTRERWTRWAGNLRRLGLAGLAAWLIEAAGPLRLIGAQALYAGRGMAGDDLMALADLLEDPRESEAFAEFLRADRPSK